MIYAELFKKLNQMQVRYSVSGGMALVLHGVVKQASSLDIVIELTRPNIDKLALSLMDLGYTVRRGSSLEDFRDDKARRQLIERKKMKEFSFAHAKEPQKIVKVDLELSLHFAKLKSTVVMKKGVSIPAISASNLQVIKRYIGKPHDELDIYSLKQYEKARKKK